MWNRESFPNLKINTVIIINILGGFGNQLFQYALGRYLQTENNCEVKYLSGDALRKPELDFLRSKVEFCTPAELSHARKESNAFLLLSRKLGSATKSRLKRAVIEDYGHPFDPEMLQIQHECQLIGYWQTYLTTDPIRKILLEEIQPKNPLSDGFEALKTEIRSAGNTASLHIRRGDYLDSTTNDVHGILPLSYYEQAVAFLVNKDPETRFYVFSDDISWAKANLTWIPNSTFVETASHYEDFFLMKECKHNIIANSSFSWWAAWLNENPGKTVVRPEKWFANREFNALSFIPKDWITL